MSSATTPSIPRTGIVVRPMRNAPPNQPPCCASRARALSDGQGTTVYRVDTPEPEPAYPLAVAATRDDAVHLAALLNRETVPDAQDSYHALRSRRCPHTLLVRTRPGVQDRTLAFVVDGRVARALADALADVTADDTGDS